MKTSRTFISRKLPWNASGPAEKKLSPWKKWSDVLAWQIEFSPEANKSLMSLGSSAEKQIAKFMRNRISNLNDPRSIGEPMKGSRFAGLWRYRSGDYRVLCEIQDEKITILVVLVGHRQKIYK
ncbi:MAG: type II toxin-antitoxin system RelE/ParE family toxin [Desulfovibrio sp.]|nr:type II toxin-antitoxin system RelE/ParE family toxin [Desulfovibrio sp.]